MKNAGNVHLVEALKRIWKKTALLCASLFIFELLFSLVSTSVRAQQSIVNDLDDMPPMVRKMMGEGFVEAVLKYGIIAIGYIHPFLLVIFILFIFIAASQVVTSEISSGAIGFTLSRPISRKRLVLNLAIVTGSGLTLLCLSTFLSSLAGIALFYGQEMSLGPFASLSWDHFLVMLFIAGYVVILSVLSDSGKVLFTRGGILLLAFYLLSMAAPLWKPLSYLSPLNPFAYYQPMKLLMGARIELSTAAALIVVSAVMFAAAAWLFSRRDIHCG